jgi:hypothetical protein
MDAYEIQVYDGTANDPGRPGIELHANRDNRAQETHLTLEPSYGVARGWEVGAYLQTAFLADGSFAYSGAKLRSKHVARFGESLRAGVNLELSVVPSRVEPDHLGGEARPIVAWENAWVALAFNPIVGLSGLAPTFEPAAFAKAKIAGAVAIGVEYYASFGEIGRPAPWREQEHYVFQTIDLIAWHDFELDVGFGEGVSPASHPFIGKVIVGYTF